MRTSFLLPHKLHFASCAAVAIDNGDVDAGAPARNVEAGLLLPFVNFLAVTLPPVAVVAAQFHVGVVFGVFKFQCDAVLLHRIGKSGDGYLADALAILLWRRYFVHANKQPTIAEGDKPSLWKPWRSTQTIVSVGAGVEGVVFEIKI